MSVATDNPKPSRYDLRTRERAGTGRTGIRPQCLNLHPDTMILLYRYLWLRVGLKQRSIVDAALRDALHVAIADALATYRRTGADPAPWLHEADLGGRPDPTGKYRPFGRFRRR